MRVHTDDLISVTDAAKVGVSRLVSDAEDGMVRVILRNSRPVAVILSLERFEELVGERIAPREPSKRLLLRRITQLGREMGGYDSAAYKEVPKR